MSENVPADTQKQHTLVRSMGLGALVIYGVGDMLGTGIYGLIGKAAGEMGNMVWLAFVASMIAAGFTGLSYASLGSRYPRAAGAAYVTQRAYGRPFLSYLVGLAVMASGVTSMGAASHAFADYFRNFVPGAPTWGTILIFLALLTAVNFWGMRESTWFNAFCTAVEAGGLLFVIAVGVRYWGQANLLDATSPMNPSGHLTPTLLLGGAVLTFYSFVGFEDMLNVAEEVKDVRRTFPRALITALLVTTLLYLAVSVTAVSVLTPAQLAAESSGLVGKGAGPLVKVVSVAAPWMHPKVFAAVSLFAIANTALLNYIMGSRLVYGMARHGLLPGVLGRVHARRRTPHLAMLAVLALLLVLTFSGKIADLAKATSLLLLCVFMVVNAALLVLKRRSGEARGAFEVPSFVPMCGILVCGALVAAPFFSARPDYQPALIAGVILMAIAVLYLLTRPKVSEESFAELEGFQNP